MNIEDIRIGMKVALKENMRNSNVWRSCCIYKKQPYMYVIQLCEVWPTSIVVCGEDNASVMGDYFYASDLTPYEEQYTCNIPGVTVELVPGKEYWVSDTSMEHAIRNKELHKYVCTVKETHIFEGYYTVWATWKYAVDPDTYKEPETEMTVEEIAEALRKRGVIKGKLKIKE